MLKQEKNLHSFFLMTPQYPAYLSCKWWGVLGALLFGVLDESPFLVFPGVFPGVFVPFPGVLDPDILEGLSFPGVLPGVEKMTDSLSHKQE